MAYKMYYAKKYDVKFCDHGLFNHSIENIINLLNDKECILYNNNEDKVEISKEYLTELIFELEQDDDLFNMYFSDDIYTKKEVISSLSEMLEKSDKNLDYIVCGIY